MKEPSKKQSLLTRLLGLPIVAEGWSGETYFRRAIPLTNGRVVVREIADIHYIGEPDGTFKRGPFVKWYHRETLFG